MPAGPGQTRLALTDPNDTSMIFIKYGPEDEARAQAYKDPSLTPLQRATKMAERLRDYHLHDHSAGHESAATALSISSCSGAG